MSLTPFLTLSGTTPDPAASLSCGAASDPISCPQRRDAFASPVRPTRYGDDLTVCQPVSISASCVIPILLRTPRGCSLTCGTSPRPTRKPSQPPRIGLARLPTDVVAPSTAGLYPSPRRVFPPGPDAGATPHEGTWSRTSRPYNAPAQKYPASPPRVHSTRSKSMNITSNRTSVP